MVDESHAPAFEEIDAKPSVSRDAMSSSRLPNSATHRLRLVAVVVVSSVALLAVIGFFVATSAPTPGEPGAQKEIEDVAEREGTREAPTETGRVGSTVARAELERLNRVCDALLATIGRSDSGTTVQSDDEIDQEMVWPTGTDSLISFDTLSFNDRTAR